MKKEKIWIIVTSLLLLIGSAHSLSAQGLAQQGTSIDDIVPAGWLHKEAQGDLNKDGFPDLVVVATPDFEENLKMREDGYVYNFNQPILAIYFGKGQSQLQLWKHYDNVIPADEDENCSHEVSVEITSRGTLRISILLFCSMGGYETTFDTYTYRFQNGDFFLIGLDKEESQRNTGNCITISENYLTWKRQETRENIFYLDRPPTEKWTRIPKRPLEKLGEREL